MLATQRQVITLDGPSAQPNGRPYDKPYQMNASRVPTWDRTWHTLFWREQVVKRFQKVAPNQEAVLQLFHDHGWPTHVNAALLHISGLAAKGWLRDTIRNLNRSVRPWLRFHLEGSGSRIRWEAR